MVISIHHQKRSVEEAAVELRRQAAHHIRLDVLDLAPPRAEPRRPSKLHVYTSPPAKFLRNLL